MKKWIALTAFLSISSLSATSQASTVLCTVIADGTSGKVLKQEGTCDRRITAASTFKIALSLMGKVTRANARRSGSPRHTPRSRSWLSSRRLFGTNCR
jgi:beta-lactamase class D